MRTSIFQGKIGGPAAQARGGEGGGLPALLQDCAVQGRTVFLFGGDCRTAYALRDRVASAFPTLRIAGFCDADFAGPIDRALLDHIAAAHADVIVSDLPDARFRLFSAQYSVAGIYGQRLNLPESFSGFAFAARRGFTDGVVPKRLSRFAAAAMAGIRFVCIVLMQALRRARPQAVAGRGAVVSPRRDGRG